MHNPRCLPQLICTTLIFLASSCAPVTQAAPYPNPQPPINTRTPFPVLTATKLPSPNIPPELLFTPTPDPNAFTISAQIDQEYSQEEITKILFSKWLDHYMGENISPEMRLTEYTINSITIPNNQKCAPKLGALFMAEAEVTAKTLLPTHSTTSYNISHWMISASGYISESETHRTILFNSAISRLKNEYTLTVITHILLCD